MEAQSTDLEYLRELIVPLLNPEERETFELREGVKFYLDYEVFFGPLSGLLEKKEVAAARANGSLELKVRGLIDKMRRGTLGYEHLFRYLRAEVLKEINYTLQSILVDSRRQDRVLQTHEKVPDWVSLKKQNDHICSYLVEAVNSHEFKNRILAADVDHLAINGKVSKVLHDAGINTVGKLIEFTEEEVSKLEGIGPNARNQLRDALYQKRLKFREAK